MKKLIVLLSLLSFSVLLPQDEQQIPLNLTFNHIALSVKDLNQSVDFYKGVLNLTELSKESRAEGVRWFSMSEGKEPHLISHKYFSGDSVKTNKAVHLALATNRFDDLLTLLDSRGIVYGDWKGEAKAVEKRSDGVRQVFLKDPDGYWIEINSVGEN